MNTPSVGSTGRTITLISTSGQVEVNGALFQAETSMFGIDSKLFQAETSMFGIDPKRPPISADRLVVVSP